jgi:hypothetical protein
LKLRNWGAPLAALLLTTSGVLGIPGSASAEATTTLIEDTARGTGIGQMSFSSGWNACSGNCDKASDGSFQWTSTVGATATIRFSGNRITLYGMKEPWAYLATARIDGGAPSDVDYYAATASTETVDVYTSPELAQGVHTLVLTMTDRKNAASAGGMSITLDSATVASETAPAGPHASGLPWSDGGFFEHSAQRATDFAEWRGRPVDNIVAFTSRGSWDAQLIPWWGDTVPDDGSFVPARDDFILSVPLWTDDGDAGADADWARLAQEIAAIDPDGYVRLGWEMNCCFSTVTDLPRTSPDFPVGAHTSAEWRAQYSRAVDRIRAAAPGLRIVFNPNEGVSGDGLTANPSTLYVAGKADVVAIDAYDWYPAYNSDANADEHFTKTYGWDYWYDFARSRGLPFALAEFSVYSGSDDSGGDNPAYFSYVYDWLTAKNTAVPGSIAFVSLFDDSAEYCGCNLNPIGGPDPVEPNPNAAARYRSLIAALSE